VESEQGTVLRELPAQAQLRFEDFVDFHGSIHAIYARRHWHGYSHLPSEDVLHDAQILLAAGGQAPLTQLPYLLQLHAASLCATREQACMNLAYATLRDATTEPRLQRLYQTKLDMGERFAQAQQSEAGVCFHRFVQSQELVT
jgi:hypothetical protein